MMATTHALAGLAVALAALGAAGVAPGGESGLLVLAAGLLGGLFPDGDLYTEHRRHLHYPLLYPVAAVAGLVTAVALPGIPGLVIAVFLLAAALHCAMDIFGGGLELRPWRATSERAVYDHVRGRWLRPRRWVRYDGAPEDLLLGVAFALPALLTPVELLNVVAAAALGVSTAYVVLRRPIAALTGWLAARVPVSARPYLPERFLEDEHATP